MKRLTGARETVKKGGFFFRARKISLLGGALLICLAGVILWGTAHYRLTPLDFLRQGCRNVIVSSLAFVYQSDMEKAESLSDAYQVGSKRDVSISSIESWRRIAEVNPRLLLHKFHNQKDDINLSPFVYEKYNAPQLVAFRKKYDFQNIVGGVEDEYEKMLRVGEWIGSRWDHGLSDVPGGKNHFAPIDVIEAGTRGRRFWCEIAAKLTVQVASAMAWPARYVGMSKAGHGFKSDRHAVAELWSNRFDKWFVLDTDFNVVFESDGIPMSAYELCKMGSDLQTAGRLRIRNLGAPKPSLPLIDTIPYYRYIFIDLRNDWYTRRLRQGSPAGGDLSTWWTARQCEEPVLTLKKRVDKMEDFNWPVNRLLIFLRRLVNETGSENSLMEIELKGYAPYFTQFQVSLDDNPWQGIDDDVFRFAVSSGPHALKARMVLLNQSFGPTSSVQFELLIRQLDTQNLLVVLM